MLGLARVDVLEVDVRDPVRRLPGELGGVGAADEQVPGVQAQRDGRPVEHPLHLGGVLDHRADVRVQNGADPLLESAMPLIRLEVVQQRLPALVVELGAAVVSVLAADRRQHQRRGVGRDVALEDPLDLGHRVVARHVQQQRGESADGLQAVLGEDGGHRVRLGRQEAVRPELGGEQPDLAHLGEDLVGPELVTPAGHLADAPRDRGAGDPERSVGHRCALSGVVIARAAALHGVRGGCVVAGSVTAASQSGFATADGRRPSRTSTTPRAASAKVAAVALRVSPIRCGVRDDARVVEDRVVYRGLGLEDVEADAGQLPGLQRRPAPRPGRRGRRDRS